MKKFAGMLVTPVLAAFGSSAGAISLSPNGLGELLIYPYYTVNKDQDTLISIANASDAGKAVTVFVMEGYNGRTVLNFNVLLSSHDVWTAAITSAEGGGALLRTRDSSCTDPQIPTQGVEFSKSAYDGTGVVPSDSGPQGIERVREGYIVVVARGDIDPASAVGQAMTHVQNGTPDGGVPADCAHIGDALLSAEAVTPTDSLYGSGTIINVGLGTFFAYNADALAHYTDIPLFSPASNLFTPFVDTNSEEATHGVARSYTWDADGTPVVADWVYGFDAVSAVLMADSIQNEYLVSPSLGANTDWVVTFPTKQFYVDEPLYGPGTPLPPFAESFHEPGIALIDATANHYDREEGASTQPPACDPSFCPAPPLLSLAYEVNVLSYVPGSGMSGTSFASGTPSRVLGSTLTYSALDPDGSSGFTSLDLFSGDGQHILPGGIAPDGNPISIYGLPTIGFMVYNIINTDAQPGLLANYGGLFAHKATTACVGAAPCAMNAR